MIIMGRPKDEMYRMIISLLHMLIIIQEKQTKYQLVRSYMIFSLISNPLFRTFHIQELLMSIKSILEVLEIFLGT